MQLQHSASVSQHAGTSLDACRAVTSPSPRPALPDSIPSVLDGGQCLELKRINGFSGELTHAMARSPGGSNELFYIAATNLVAMHLTTQQQRFFHGHTENIVAFAFDGALLCRVPIFGLSCCRKLPMR